MKPDGDDACQRVRLSVLLEAGRQLAIMLSERRKAFHVRLAEYPWQRW